MSQSSKILIAFLVVSYLAMVAFLSYRYPDQENLMLQGAFGLVLIGVAIIGIKISMKNGKSRGVGRAFKVLFASLALVFAVWMGGSVLTLPVVGYRGFELLGRGWFGVFWLAGAVLVAPFVSKRLS